MFSGSYSADDVIFLLKPVEVEFTPVALKESLIQSGTRHYSEMLSRESIPSEEYLQLFRQALHRHQTRFARDVIRLAMRIAECQPEEITLVSLARAGTPIGALLKRTLQRLGRSTVHYSISLIRDRGIDTVALRFLLNSHDPASFVFVDGWTGKGVMASELRQAVQDFYTSNGVQLNPGLFVIADLSGTAAEAATDDDYLIPPSLLGSTVSGLISRSILNPQIVGARDFHGCVYQTEFASNDLSGWFLDYMTEQIEQHWSDPENGQPVMTDSERQSQRQRSQQLVSDMVTRFGVKNPHFVKPGIGEATRVLLRRVPSLVLLRDDENEDVRHLLTLADRRNVPVLVDRELPYHAVALIQNVSKGES